MIRRFLLQARALAARSPTRLAFFSVIALGTFWRALGAAGDVNEFRDATFLFSYYEVAVDTVRKYGQAPLWNPYYCGGMYALGALQENFASPAFLLSLVFGAARSQVLIAYLMLVVGMEGTYRFFRQHRTSALAAAMAAPLTGLNGLYAASYFKGWLMTYAFALVPWLLYGIHRAVRRDPWALIILPVAMMWMIGLGLSYAPVLGALYCAIELGWALARRWRREKKVWDSVGWIAVAGVLAIGLTAIRLWPLAVNMSQTPRLMAGAPGNTLATLGVALFSLSQPGGYNLGMPGAFFFAAVALPLVLLGVFRRRLWPGAVLVIASVWLATGYRYGAGPFTWLRGLPGFEMTRYPERYLFFACLYGSLLGAGAVDLILIWCRRRPRGAPVAVVAVALLAISIVPMILNHQMAHGGMWLGAPPLAIDQPFAQARGNRWLTLYFQPQNRGTLSCMEGHLMPQSTRLRGDLPQEEYLADPGAGSARRTAWSPERIDVHVSLNRPARLLVNQNWHSGWRSNLGTVVSDEGLLAVDLPAGQHDVRLRFLPRSAVGGAFVSCAALAAMIVLFRRTRRGRSLFCGNDRWVTLGCLASLGLAAVAVRALVPEAPAAPLPAVNANRAPFLADRVPDGAKTFQADFDVPVQLLAATLPRGLNPAGIGDFELYWKVNGRVPKAVGVFVHLQAPSGRRLFADHEVIGTSAFFANTPRGRLVRDAFSIDLSRAEHGVWRVYAGLWNIAGDRRRIPIKTAQGAETVDDSVLVGTFEL